MTSPGAGRGVVAGAFSLLHALQEAGGNDTLSGLAARTGLPNATAHRLLGQLVAVGAVERRARRYAVGMVLHELGAGWEPRAGLREAAHLPLRALARSGAEVVLLAFAAERLVVVDRVDGALRRDVPDPRDAARDVADALGERAVSVVHGRPSPRHACAAAAVPGTDLGTLIAVAALVDRGAPVERLAGPVVRAAEVIGHAVR